MDYALHQAEGDVCFANVRGHLLPLAFGTKGCSAADVPKVPQAW